MTELLPVISSKRWIHTGTLWKECKAQGLDIETKSWGLGPGWNVSRSNYYQATNAEGLKRA